MRTQLLFSVIPHYLSVASGQEIFLPAQRPARRFIFSRYSREMHVLSRDRTGRGAHAEFKRHGHFYATFIYTRRPEKFSPRIISNDRYFFLR